MRRRNVAEFILANPSSITITRKGTPTKTAAGGITSGSVVTLSPQVCRIVQNVRRYTSGIVNSEMGDLPKALYLLIARYNINLKKDDRFILDGETYVVTGIHKQRKESTLATIDLYGPNNGSV